MHSQRMLLNQILNSIQSSAESFLYLVPCLVTACKLTINVEYPLAVYGISECWVYP